MTIAVIDSAQKIVTNGLLLNLDAAQLRSYPGTGTNWQDLSGNENNATLTNGPTFNSSNGGSIVFDGSNDFATLPAKTYNFPSGVTFELWVYPIVLNNDNRLFSFFGGQLSANSLQVLVFSSGGVSAEVGNSQRASVGTFLVTNVWQQIVFTANGTNHIWYKNGILNVSYNSTIIPTSIARNDAKIAANTNGGNVYNGRTAIFNMYGRGLTGTEVLQNFNANRSRFGL